MKYLAIVAAAAALMFGSATASYADTAASSASPAPTDGAVLARAKTWFTALQSGKIDRSQLTPEVDRGLTSDTLKAVAAKVAPLGAPVSFEQVQTGTQAGSTFWVYKLTFKDGDVLDFIFALDANGKVSGLRFTGPQ